MAKLYGDLKSAKQWAGRRVITTREISNGLGSIPAGTLGTIASGYHIREGNLHFKADKCPGCGLALICSRLHYADFKGVE